MITRLELAGGRAYEVGKAWPGAGDFRVGLIFYEPTYTAVEAEEPEGDAKSASAHQYTRQGTYDVWRVTDDLARALTKMVEQIAERQPLGDLADAMGRCGPVLQLSINARYVVSVERAWHPAAALKQIVESLNTESGEVGESE